jgi:hypothetical protein
MALSAKNAKALSAPWTRWFFYGDTGSGKTLLAATFPNPCFIQPINEGSMVTLRGRDIGYYEAQDMSSQLRGGIGGMNRIIDELEREYKANPQKFPYDTIVVESLTHYSELVVEELSEQGTKQMDQRKWGEVAAHFRNIHARLCNMQVHVVYTSLAKIDKNDAGVIVAGPFIQGAAAAKLPSSCEVVGYCEVSRSNRKVNGVATDQTAYRTHFKKHGHFPARTRFDAMPDVIENFNFSEVEQYLTETNDTKNPATGDK